MTRRRRSWPSSSWSTPRRRAPQTRPVSSCSTASPTPCSACTTSGRRSTPRRSTSTPTVQVWTSPAEGARSHSRVRRSTGVANAFEANVPWELQQGDTVVQAAGSPRPRSAARCRRTPSTVTGARRATTPWWCTTRTPPAARACPPGRTPRRSPCSDRTSVRCRSSPSAGRAGRAAGCGSSRTVRGGAEVAALTRLPRSAPAGAGQQRGGQPRRRRSTCAAPTRPSRTGSAPTVAKAASSSSLIPPSGPTTTTISPRPGTGEVRERTGRAPRGAPRARTRRRSRRDDLVGGRPARSPRGTTSGGPAWPPRGRSSATSPATSRPARPRHTATRARRRPRHDDVDADLGEHLDGELAAVALGDAPGRRPPRGSRARRCRPRRRSRTATSCAVAATVHRGRRTGAVGQRRPARRRGSASPRRRAAPRRRSTSTASPAATAGERGVHERPAGSSGGLNASRSRPNTDLCGAWTWPSGDSSSRSAASSRSSSSWRSSSRVGVSTTIRDDQVAAAGAAQRRARRGRAAPSRCRTGCRARCRARRSSPRRSPSPATSASRVGSVDRGAERRGRHRDRHRADAGRRRAG